MEAWEYPEDIGLCDSNELSQMYWIEEDEMRLGIHPSQIIKKINNELENLGENHHDISFLNYLDNNLVEVSLNNKHFGTFDYIKNCFKS